MAADNNLDHDFISHEILEKQKHLRTIASQQDKIRFLEAEVATLRLRVDKLERMVSYTHTSYKVSTPAAPTSLSILGDK